LMVEILSVVTHLIRLICTLQAACRRGRVVHLPVHTCLHHVIARRLAPGETKGPTCAPPRNSFSNEEHIRRPPPLVKAPDCPLQQLKPPRPTPIQVTFASVCPLDVPDPMCA
jgi:hypothetical protein